MTYFAITSRQKRPFFYKKHIFCNFLHNPVSNYNFCRLLLGYYEKADIKDIIHFGYTDLDIPRCSIMEQTTTKLWNRNFSLLMTVQILAFFVNTTLSFVLPLHILYISGSPALFGTILALAGIPLIMMTPLGGIIADRGKKKRIIFWMDFSTTIVITLYMLLSGFFTDVVPIVIAKLLALNVIQGIYMPTTMASVRFLVPKEKLVPANAVAGMIFSLANATGPAIGTILYARFNLFPILAGCGVIFVIVCIMDLFLRIPHEGQDKSKHISEMVKNDLSRSMRFLTREKTSIGKLSVILFLFTIPSVAMVIVALPVLVTQTLAMDMEMLAISQAAMMGGGLLGGFLVGNLEKKLPINKAHRLLAACTAAILAAGLVFLMDAPLFIIFAVITVSGFMILLTTQIVLIGIIAYAQLESPPEIVGKISAVVMALALAAYPIGQFLFGVLFERLAEQPHLVMFTAVIMSAVITAGSRGHFKRIA